MYINVQGVVLSSLSHTHTQFRRGEYTGIASGRPERNELLFLSPSSDTFAQVSHYFDIGRRAGGVSRYGNACNYRSSREQGGLGIYSHFNSESGSASVFTDISVTKSTRHLSKVPIERNVRFGAPRRSPGKSFEVRRTPCITICMCTL